MIVKIQIKKRNLINLRKGSREVIQMIRVLMTRSKNNQINQYLNLRSNQNQIVKNQRRRNNQLKLKIKKGRN